MSIQTYTYWWVENGVGETLVVNSKIVAAVLRKTEKSQEGTLLWFLTDLEVSSWKENETFDELKFVYENRLKDFLSQDNKTLVNKELRKLKLFKKS